MAGSAEKVPFIFLEAAMATTVAEMGLVCAELLLLMGSAFLTTGARLKSQPNTVPAGSRAKQRLGEITTSGSSDDIQGLIFHPKVASGRFSNFMLCGTSWARDYAPSVLSEPCTPSLSHC